MSRKYQELKEVNENYINFVANDWIKTYEYFLNFYNERTSEKKATDYIFDKFNLTDFEQERFEGKIIKYLVERDKITAAAIEEAATAAVEAATKAAIEAASKKGGRRRKLKGGGGGASIPVVSSVPPNQPVPPPYEDTNLNNNSFNLNQYLRQMMRVVFWNMDQNIRYEIDNEPFPNRKKIMFEKGQEFKLRILNSPEYRQLENNIDRNPTIQDFNNNIMDINNFINYLERELMPETVVEPIQVVEVEDVRPSSSNSNLPNATGLGRRRRLKGSGNIFGTRRVQPELNFDNLINLFFQKMDRYIHQGRTFQDAYNRSITKINNILTILHATNEQRQMLEDLVYYQAHLRYNIQNEESKLGGQRRNKKKQYKEIKGIYYIVK
jgi:hypothetical protein